MGKSQKPLTILCTDPHMLTWPEIQELVSKGHRVGTWIDVKQASLQPESIDLVMGPDCWRMTPLLRSYLKEAIAAARKARYPLSHDVPS